MVTGLRCAPAIAGAAVVAFAGPAFGQHEGHRHGLGDDEHGHEFTLVPPALGADLSTGWLDPWPHTHYSRRGTPFVHLFGGEPAFIDRDLFLDSGVRDGAEGTETEIEAELEYAITRRIALVVEAPYILLNPEEGESEHGPGDVEVVPRLMLLEYDRFILSANLGFSFPPGDSSRGLGSGEAALGPSVAAWIDLGGDAALHASLGVEHGLRSDLDVLTWGSALTYSIELGGGSERFNGEGEVRSHFPAGLVRGEHPLDGEDEGGGSAELFLGAAFSIGPHLEVRGAVVLPAWNPREFDKGVIVGVVYHF
jgi:hypothetical protein